MLPSRSMRALFYTLLFAASLGPLAPGESRGQVLESLAVLPTAGLYAQAEPAPAPARGAGEELSREGLHLVELFAEGQVVFLTGFVSARELSIEGNRFYFQDIDAGIGEKGGGGVRFNI